MIYAPPSVFCPKGDPALKSIPPSSSVPRETLPSGVAPFIFYPERDPTLHPPRFSLCATSSLSIISRGQKRSYLEPTHALGKSATITYVR